MKSLNVKATNIIKILYEAMSNPQYNHGESHGYAKIQNNPSVMPVVIEKSAS